MDDKSTLSRRGWLRALTSTVGVIGGCSTVDGGGSASDFQRTPSVSGPRSETAAVSESGAPWPSFRRDNRNTGHAPDEPGVAGRPEQKWNVSTDAGVWSSPVVVDGSLYIGSMDGTVYAIDTATGDVDWTYQADGPIESTPAVAGDSVYVGSLDKHVYCLDAETGTEQWSYETAGLIHGSPTVDRSTVYIGSGALVIEEILEYMEANDVEQEGSGLYALDRKTGELVWRRFTGHLISSTPAVVDSAVFIGLIGKDDSRSMVASVDAADGERRWEYETDSEVLSSPTVRSNTVYAGDYGGFVYALSAETGDPDWEFPIQSGQIRGSTAVTEDAVYVPVSRYEVADPNPALVSLSRTGEEQWAHVIPGARQMGSSPCATSDAVYVGTHYREGGGGMYAVDHDGNRLWGRELRIGEGVGSSPAVIGETLYYGAADNTVYALE